LDKILEAHYKASAQEKMQKVETIITSGKNIYSMAGIESTFIMYQIRPNKLRIESEFQGSKVIQTYNGQAGWMYAPAMGIAEPKEMKGQELESILSQSEFENPLWNYEEKGSSLELVGASEEGSADHLRLTTKNGNELNMFIDRKSHLITSIRSLQVMGGSETEIEVNLKDYKTVKGIPYAQSIETKMSGEVVTTIEIEKIEYNKKIDPALFEKPATE
jgi:outer membrane lipoprotein-sorting protein